MLKSEIITPNSGYLAAGNFNTDNGLMEELEGLSSSFDKVKISGGSLRFEVTGTEGSPEFTKEIEGVILYHHTINSFYKEKYSGCNTLPDCGSYDGKVGGGNPGGNCMTCPNNQFGSADNGNGKACKNKRRIFILREGEMLPMMLSLPTGSLKEFSNFVRRLVSKGKRPHTLVTRISLKKATSSLGIQFSKVVFSLIRDLTDEEIEAVLPLVDHIKESSVTIAWDLEAERSYGGGL